jgi:predicted ester cyclase
MSLLAIVQKHEGNFNSGNLDADREVFNADVAIEAPGAGMMKGIDAHLAFIRGWKAAFPDGKLDISLAVEQGDLIIGEGMFTGTHTGDLVGAAGTIPATGRRVELKFADLYRITDGKIAEHRVYFDQVSFLTQLGLMPGN